MSNKEKTGHFATCMKEFKFCAIATIAYILISCLLCQMYGYGVDGKAVTFIYGIPKWAVVGVLIPWVLMVILTAIYGFCIMKGDEE